MFYYDLIIIGSGPAGISAAFLAAKNNVKTLLIEKKPDNLGGVCLNAGCIPLKGFIYYSKFEKDYSLIKEKIFNKIKILRDGLKSRLLNYGIQIINAEAKFISANEVAADGKIFKAKNIIIATGSDIKRVFNDENVFSFEKLYNLQDDFKRILIIGAGPAGLEFASFFNNLNKDVTLIEIMPFVLPWMDKESVNYYVRKLKEKNIKLLLESKIEKISKDKEVLITTGENKIKEKFDVIIEAAGRKPETEKLFLKNAGIKTDEKGFIIVNENYQTAAENIYAVGDCINTPMLAYIASKEGEIAMQYILTGEKNKIEYDKIPKIVFSTPQAGSVGEIITDENTKTYKYFFKANGKAFIEGNDAGFLKIFVDKKKNIIKGACIIGDEIAEILNALSIIIKNEISTKSIKNTIFLHPSYGEIILETLENGI